LRALIVDDEPLARQRLRTMLADHPDVAIVGESETADEALRAIRGLRPDVVFLDVQMPGMDGFHVLDTMNVTPAPFVVMVTGQAEHAVRAFDRAAGDYLLKPYDHSRLAKAIGRARAALQHRGGYLERMAVTLGKRTVFVATSAIDWIEARDNYACLHVGQQQHLVRETLATLEGRLDPKLWVRIHRSAIVRFDRIKELRNLGLGDRAVILQDGTELPVGQKYRDRLPQG
jgi:two-component system, LytTR family, response regulator